MLIRTSYKITVLMIKIRTTLISLISSNIANTKWSLRIVR